MLRVAVTRPRERTGRTCRTLRDAGFVAVQRSLLRIETAHAAVAASANRLTDVDWLLFTSAEGVQALNAVRRAQGWAWPASLHAACVGPATARAASEAGLAIGMIPQMFDGAALAESLLREPDIAQRRFFWPRAEAANTGLGDRLRDAGAQVRDVVAYRTLPNECGARRLERDIRSGTVDVVTFFSPSAIDAYVRTMGSAAGDVVIAVLGRVTGDRARDHGLTVQVQPQTHTIRALADSLREYAAKH